MFDTSQDFLGRWAELDRRDRRRLRRLVRLGRLPDDPDERSLSTEYAAFQCNRLWIRYFWIWFLPGVVFGLSVASQIHPVVIGVVLAVGAQAVFAWRNLRRAARG